MNESVIIQVKVGEVPPRAYLEEVLKNCPTCFGLAIQEKDGEQEILDVTASPETIGIDKLMEVLEVCKDVPVVLTLGKMVQDFNKECDPMPFIFEQADSNGGEPEAVLAIFLEGDAPNYTKVGQGHTEMYNFWEDFLFPTLMEKFEASADLPSFYDKLKTSAFQQAVLNPFSHRGVAVFVPMFGDIIAYGKNDVGAEYPWGCTSNNLNWQAVTEKKGVMAKAKSRLAALTGGKAATTPVTAHTQDDKGVNHIPETPTQPEKKEEVPAPVVKDGLVSLKPPAKLQGNARNAWIRLFTNTFEGPMPAGHHSKDFTVNVPENLVPYAMEDISTKDQVKNLTKRVKAVMPDTTETVQDPAKVLPAAAPPAPATTPTPAEPEKRPISDFLPELSADAKKGSVDLVTDWATRPLNQTPPAMEIQRMESKWPAFSTVMGIKPADMLNWTISDIKLLSKKYPDAIALAFIEMKHRALSSGAFATELMTQPEKKKEVSAPPAEEATPAKKRSRLASITGKAA